MENRRKSEDNEMQLKTGRQAWKISKKRDFRKLFADPFRNAKISQTHFAMRKFTNPNSQCEISQCQMPFRNAKIDFAMPILISQCEISQCQMPFRNANFEFTLPIPISQCENLANPNSQCENFAMRNFAMPRSISHCEIHCLCEIQFRKPFRIAKFTLRNLQALSSFVINAEPPSIFGVLLFCPIT